MSEQDISDLELGRAVRASSEKFVASSNNSVQTAYFAMLALVRLCHDLGGTDNTLKLSDMHREGVPLGDWKVTVKRIKAPKGVPQA